MEIRRLRDEGDPAFTGLRRLWGEVFGRSPDAAYWRWKYGSPFRYLYVALEKGEVVGVRGLLPVRMLRRGETWPAVQACDAAVAAAHRGRGLYGRLTRHALAEAAKAGFRLAYSFPNSNSAPIFAHWGWRRLAWLPARHRLLLPAPFARRRRAPFPPRAAGPLSPAGAKGRRAELHLARQFPAGAEPPFDRRWEELWERLAAGGWPEKAGLSSVRDPSFLRWRFSPPEPREGRYAFWLAEEADGTPAGYFIVRVGERRRGLLPGRFLRGARLVDALLSPESFQSLPALVDDLAEELRADGVSYLQFPLPQGVFGGLLDRALASAGHWWIRGGFEVVARSLGSRREEAGPTAEPPGREKPAGPEGGRGPGERPGVAYFTLADADGF